MSQDWDVPQNSLAAKAIDFALVIAGWPTIYTVAKAYALPSTGTLSTASGFQGPTVAWASLPEIEGASVHGRPEEGSRAIAQLEIEISDRNPKGIRDAGITDLCCRQAYLEDSAYAKATLLADVSATATTLQISSIADFQDLSATGGVAFIGQECLKYSAATPETKGGSLTIAERGFRSTTAAPHRIGAGAYPFMPTIYWRRATVYKGYQEIPVDDWIPAFSGIVAGISRSGSRTRFRILDPMALVHAGGEQLLLERALAKSGVLNDDGLNGMEDHITVDIKDPTNLDGGHYLFDLYGLWVGIKSAEDVT